LDEIRERKTERVRAVKMRETEAVRKKERKKERERKSGKAQRMS
jgi:hypothetical protein